MESGKPETSSKIIPDRQKLEYCAKVLLTNTFIEPPSNARSEIYKLESYLVKTNAFLSIQELIASKVLLHFVSSFKLDVKGKKYEPPQFLKFDRISDEDCVHEALNINILRLLNLAGCHHELKEEYIHHITFPSMIGEPEFVCCQINRNINLSQILLVIEVKTRWVLSSNNENLADKYTRGLGVMISEEPSDVTNSVEQIYGCMITWFMRQDANILYINDTFNIGEQPTLLQAFDYIQFLAHKNPTASTPPSTPSLSSDYDYTDSKEDTKFESDSDYKPTIKHY
ncbi:8572_t:CDS:2 [Entrophospora sp. SA101]|nr:8572_t:CDS:2 [Entrophospora sp. SA101]